MRETLPQFIITTVSTEHDRAKKELRPSEDRIRLSDYPVRTHGPGPQRPFVDVQLEVHAERELRRNWDEEDIGELAMCAREESPAAMRVPEDVAT